MSIQPIEPNERTVALGQHRVERAVLLWRNGFALAESMPYPRSEEYRQAVAAVLPALAMYEDIPRLIVAYYHGEPGPHVAIQRVCMGTADGLPLNRGIIEDACYYARYRQIVSASRG